MAESQLSLQRSTEYHPQTRVDAHHAWTLAGLRSVRAPKAEWCKSYDTLCPPGLSLLGICCADRFAHGMGSHFQFEGHFLSLLVDLAKGTVWDARIDVAS